MQIKRLDHINIRTNHLEEMVEWYAGILGLQLGARPDFPFPGAWLYAGEDAIVHLVGHEGDEGVGSEVGLKLEHFALSATGRAAFEERMKEKGFEFETMALEKENIVQIHVKDPDGNHIHIDFAADE